MTHHLIFFSIHGHGQIQVRRHCCRSDRDAILISDVQMSSDVQSSGQCGCSCESQQALHSQTLPQYLQTHHIIYHSREQSGQLTVKEPPIHTPSLTHLTESQVAGSKVVWPLWDTVSFVYTGKGHRRELLSSWQTPSTWTTSTNQSLWGEEQHTHLAWFHLEKQ